MEAALGISPAATVAILRRSLSSVSYKIRNSSSLRKATDNGDIDPLFQAATERAYLRFQETRRQDPLFVDPYVGCLIPSDYHQMEVQQEVPRHCLVTKFIDDKLLGILNDDEDVRQVVLFTDGMDTRPYRLKWPRSCTIFDISPQKVHERATRKLDDIGAKIARSCLFLHVPSESPNIEELLRSKGFQGSRRSIWAFQGLPVENLASFEQILLSVSNMAMKGCYLLGELPACAIQSHLGTKSSKEKWIDKFFMSNGFRVSIIGVATSLSEVPNEEEEYKDILFIAEQLRHSDDQMEIWRRELHRFDEEADEDGFEEL